MNQSLIKCYLILITGLIINSISYAATAADQQNLNMGIYAINLTTHKVMRQENSDRYYAPASNLKLFTATASLLYLGPKFRYDTVLSMQRKYIRDNTLDTDLQLTFSGDPTLTEKNLYNLLKNLTQHGIRKITSNIIINDAAFDKNYYGDGWANDQLHICYSGPVSALNINHNCFQFYLMATKKNQLTAVVESDNMPYEINNQALTLDNKNAPLRIAYNQLSHAFDLTGDMPIKAKPLHFEVAIPDSLDYVEKLITEDLADLNIEFTGQFIENADQLIDPQQQFRTDYNFTHHSRTLPGLIKLMLKNSDNLIANSLLKTLGEKYYHIQGSWIAGINAEKTILAKYIKLSPDKLLIYDGSGESYYNFVTAQQIVKLLTYIYQNPILKKYIFPALPIGHTDGTLKNRFPILKNKVRAKTGSKRDVDALSGYLAHCGDEIAFSIFLNNTNMTGPGIISQRITHKRNNVLIDQVVSTMANSLPSCSG